MQHFPSTECSYVTDNRAHLHTSKARDINILTMSAVMYTNSIVRALTQTSVRIRTGKIIQPNTGGA